MPDLRTIIGGTCVSQGLGQSDNMTLRDILRSHGHTHSWPDRMIAAIADRVAAALVNDEAVEAGARAVRAEFLRQADISASRDPNGWVEAPINDSDVARAALQAAAKTIKGEA